MIDRRKWKKERRKREHVYWFCFLSKRKKKYHRSTSVFKKDVSHKIWYCDFISIFYGTLFLILKHCDFRLASWETMEMIMWIDCDVLSILGFRGMHLSLAFMIVLIWEYKSDNLWSAYSKKNYVLSYYWNYYFLKIYEIVDKCFLFLVVCYKLSSCKVIFLG